MLGLAKTRLAKSMLDAGFGEVIRQWEYKSLWNGTHALPADRFFPSTELCSPCHYQNRNLSLSHREWVCPASNTKHRRDQNAACNLRDEGVKQLVAGGILEMQNGDRKRLWIAGQTHDSG